MAKINLDKYYTPVELAKSCIEKTFEVIGRENITDIIEPSAGNGSFSLQLPNCTAYDIAPEHKSIIKQDFLKLELPYKKGRLVVGNPPFGKGTALSNRFVRKGFEIADYIAFILPIVQMNNLQEIYQFDLINSYDIGVIKYSGVQVHCCFNIYKRPFILNSKVTQYKLNDIVMKEIRKHRNQFLPDNFKYDVGICIWGSIGVECFGEGKYAKELYIYCKNRTLADKVKNVIVGADWNTIVVNKTKTPALTQRIIRKHLIEQIPELH